MSKRVVIRRRIRTLPTGFANSTFTSFSPVEAARRCNVNVESLLTLNDAVREVAARQRDMLQGLCPCTVCGYRAWADSTGRRVTMCRCMFDAISRNMLVTPTAPYNILPLTLFGLEIYIDPCAEVPMALWHGPSTYQELNFREISPDELAAATRDWREQYGTVEDDGEL